MRPEEKVFEVYPPKTKIDIYGECHDEDEELRKAYIKGCHDTVAEIMGDTIKRTELPTSLEEAAEKYLDTLEVAELFCGSYEAWQVSDAFKAGAEWQKQRDAELIEIAYNDGITIGKFKQKEQMTKDLEEDAMLLERAWLTLDGFGHEELAERLRKLKEKIC